MPATTFQSVFPIGDTDIQALPVRELDFAIAHYRRAFGFTLIERSGPKAIMQRDNVAIGLEANDSDPEQASCYVSVAGLEALYDELTANEVDVSPVRIDEYDGKRYRVFFAREPYGVCFCFGERVEADEE